MKRKVNPHGNLVVLDQFLSDEEKRVRRIRRARARILMSHGVRLSVLDSDETPAMRAMSSSNQRGRSFPSTTLVSFRGEV